MLYLREVEGYDFHKALKRKEAVYPSQDMKFHENQSSTSPYIAEIEAMHCYPYATGNFTRYMPEACEE